MNWWLIIDVILALGVTIRLTRAITVEDIGGRLLRDPADRWVRRAAFYGGELAPRVLADLAKLKAERRLANRRWWADALSCPFCVSTWIGIATFAIMAIAHTTDSWFTLVWRIVAAGLTASYVAARVLVGFGDTDSDELEDYDEQEPATTG